MRNRYSDSDNDPGAVQLPSKAPTASSGLPNRLLTAFEVAEFVGCHEETVRRAYLRGCSCRSDSACAAAAFTRTTSSTGFVVAHQRESREQKGAHTSERLRPERGATSLRQGYCGPPEL
jgi:hypothetical protein